MFSKCFNCLKKTEFRFYKSSELHKQIQLRFDSIEIGVRCAFIGCFDWLLTHHNSKNLNILYNRPLNLSKVCAKGLICYRGEVSMGRVC